MTARSLPGMSKPTTIPEGRPSVDASPDEASVWSLFQEEQQRCRTCFARLAELPQWGAGPWLDMYNEALQVHVSCQA